MPVLKKSAAASARAPGAASAAPSTVRASAPPSSARCHRTGRVAFAARVAREEDARRFAGLLHHGVVELGAFAGVDLDDPARERVAVADVALEHRRARAFAEGDEDVREHRFVVRCAREHDLDRRVELHAVGDVHVGAAVLERGRERGELVAAPIDDRAERRRRCRRELRARVGRRAARARCAGRRSLGASTCVAPRKNRPPAFAVASAGRSTSAASPSPSRGVAGRAASSPSRRVPTSSAARRTQAFRSRTSSRGAGARRARAAPRSARAPHGAAPRRVATPSPCSSRYATTRSSVAAVGVKSIASSASPTPLGTGRRGLGLRRYREARAARRSRCARSLRRARDRPSSRCGRRSSRARRRPARGAGCAGSA